MNRDGNDRIKNFFASNARDLTPASASRAAYVLYVPVSPDHGVTRHCASVLSDTELQTAERFVNECDKAQFTQRRAFRRFCGAIAIGSPWHLSQIIFEETENGRPYLSNLPDFWFSFSSCRLGILGAWSSTHGIGVDIEDPTRNLEAVELAHCFFSIAEAKAVERGIGFERLRTFFQFWSLKEAALKSIGEGIPYGLDAFEFELNPNLRVVHAPFEHGGPKQFNAHVIEETGSCAFLVTRILA
jgi:phosphopantetheinyl transferase